MPTFGLQQYRGAWHKTTWTAPTGIKARLLLSHICTNLTDRELALSDKGCLGTLYIHQDSNVSGQGYELSMVGAAITLLFQYSKVGKVYLGHRRQSSVQLQRLSIFGNRFPLHH